MWNLNDIFSKQSFEPIDVIESPLRFETSSITCFGDGKGFAIGSIEGRCSIQNYDFGKNDLGKDAQKDFCFKCHRYENVPTQGVGIVYSVNHINFNKKYNTFATFGSDGTFITWNKDMKSKYHSSKRFSLPIQAADFSDNAQFMAYAVGYDWNQGHESSLKTEPISLIVRVPDQSEVMKQIK